MPVRLGLLRRTFRGPHRWRLIDICGLRFRLRFPGIAVLVEINDRDIRPFLGEKDRNGTANFTITPVISATLPVVSRSPCNPRRRCAVAAAFYTGDQAVLVGAGVGEFSFPLAFQKRFSLLVSPSAVPICGRGRQRRKSRENPC
jgi:hypothetical protein